MKRNRWITLIAVLYLIVLWLDSLSGQLHSMDMAAGCWAKVYFGSSVLSQELGQDGCGTPSMDLLPPWRGVLWSAVNEWREVLEQ